MRTIGGKAVKTTVPELVNPETSALVLIDIQNDCCSVGGAFAERGADLSLYPGMISTAKQVLAAARKAGVLNIFVQATTLPDYRSQSPAQLLFEIRLRDNYAVRDDEEFAFCQPGSWGHAFVDGLEPLERELVVQKHRSSAFIGTNLDLILRSNGIESVIAVGCTTEGCVDSTLRDAGFLDYYPIAIRDAIASDSAELHSAGMTVLEAYRAIVVDSAEVIAAWEGGA